MQQSKRTEILVQAKALIDSQVDDIANMANICSLLTEHFDHHWIGFYRVLENQLMLGPFNGPVACTVIQKGKGVCGTAWEQKQTQVVENVHDFPGHIACSALSNSEIVIPCIRNNEVFAVLDIDSIEFSKFNQEDKVFFEELVSYL